MYSLYPDPARALAELAGARAGDAVHGDPASGIGADHRGSAGTGDAPERIRSRVPGQDVARIDRVRLSEVEIGSDAAEVVVISTTASTPARV
jgi:hypothetical protein